MSYFEAFIVPVPKAKKDAYREHASKIAPLLNELGIERLLEGWADDVPHGQVTDFYRAVQAHDDETVVFSFFEYRSKEDRDAANARFATDPRMKELGATAPFDAKRMIFGGFDAIVDTGASAGKYVSGFIVPVPRANKEEYRQMNERHAAIFREYGALRLVQGWGDDVPQGQVTDFYRAVQANPDETVVFAFLEWPSKEASARAWDRIMKDERMQPSADVPFDGKRMFWGGFDVLLDSAAQAIQTEVPLTRQV